MIDPTGIIETVVGAVVGWIANHFYSRQGSRQLKQLNDRLQQDNQQMLKLIEKLPAELLTAISSDPRHTLTLQQLGDLTRIVTELDARHQPRRLSEEQRSRIVEALRAIPISPICISAPSNDIEAQNFSEQIGAAFQQAGWPTSIYTSVAAMDVSGVAVAYYAPDLGWPHELPPPTEEDEAIRAALDKADLRADFLPLREFRPGNMRFHIIVGQKPTM